MSSSSEVHMAPYPDALIGFTSTPASKSLSTDPLDDVGLGGDDKLKSPLTPLRSASHPAVEESHRVEDPLPNHSRNYPRGHRCTGKKLLGIIIPLRHLRTIICLHPSYMCVLLGPLGSAHHIADTSTYGSHLASYTPALTSGSYMIYNPVIISIVPQLRLRLCLDMLLELRSV